MSQRISRLTDHFSRLGFRLEDFPGAETLIGQTVNGPLDAADALIRALLGQAGTLTDPVKKEFVEVMCIEALQCQLLEPKVKGYICAVGGYRDEDGRLQDFMRYTTEKLRAPVPPEHASPGEVRHKN